MRFISRTLLCLLIVVCFSGCIITPHYFTAKTLEPHKKKLTFAADNVVMASNYGEIEINRHDPTITMHIGFDWGLPYNFEVGVHYFPPSLLEGRLRWQVTPKTFRYFDLSLDGMYGKASYLEYFRYGFTISKDIHFITPYAYFSNTDVQNSHNKNGDDFNSMVNNLIIEAINVSSNVGAGFEIKLPHETKLYPELVYQIFDNHFDEGMFSFGVALVHDF